MIQSSFQLQSAPSDVFPGRLHRDRDVRLEKLRRLCSNSSPDFDLAGHDRSLCLLAAGEQAFCNLDLVKTHLLTRFLAHSYNELSLQSSLIDDRHASTPMANQY